MNEVKDSCNKHHYARTLEGRLTKDWQSLEAHLKNAAELAHSFADEFGGGLGLSGATILRSGEIFN